MLDLNFAPIKGSVLFKKDKFVVPYCRGHNCIIPDDDFSPYMCAASFAHAWSPPSLLIYKTLHTWYSMCVFFTNSYSRQKSKKSSQSQITNNAQVILKERPGQMKVIPFPHTNYKCTVIIRH